MALEKVTWPPSVGHVIHQHQHLHHHHHHQSYTGSAAEPATFQLHNHQHQNRTQASQFPYLTCNNNNNSRVEMLLCDQSQTDQHQATLPASLSSNSVGPSNGIATALPETALGGGSYPEGTNYQSEADAEHNAQHLELHQPLLQQHHHRQHQIESVGMTTTAPHEAHQMDAFIPSYNGHHSQHQHHHQQQHPHGNNIDAANFQQVQHHQLQPDLYAGQYPDYNFIEEAVGSSRYLQFKLESRSPSDSREDEFYQMRMSLQREDRHRYDLHQLEHQHGPQYLQQQQQHHHQQQHPGQVFNYSNQFGASALPAAYCPDEAGHQHLQALYLQNFSTQQQQQEFPAQTLHHQQPTPPPPPPPPPLQPSALQQPVQPVPLPPQATDLADSCLATNNRTGTKADEDATGASPKPLTAGKSSGAGACLVCGDVAACQHYGVRTCEGCKGFFKRTIQKNAQYVCLHAKNCVVDKRRRNRCQYCRFKKCINVGMVKEVVRSESLKGRRGRLSSKARQPQLQQQQQQLPSTPQPVRHKVSAPAGGSPVTLLSLLISAHQGTQPSPVPAFQSLPPSASTPSSIDSVDADLDDDSVDLMAEADRLSAAIDASLTVVEHFANQLPGFLSFEPADRTTLLRAHALDLVLARTAYRSVASSSDSPARDEDSTSPIQQQQQQQQYLDHRSIQLDSGHTFSRRCFHRLGLVNAFDSVINCGRQLRNLMDGDCATFAGLATILLVYFCPEEESLPLSNPGEVYKQHHNYIEMLKSHCCSHAKKDSTFLSRVLRQKSAIRAVTRDVMAPSLLAQLGSRLSPRVIDICSSPLNSTAHVGSLAVPPVYWQSMPASMPDDASHHFGVIEDSKRLQSDSVWH